MELRRAILLFAIVLGLAAVATSVSRPTSETETEPEPAPPPRQSAPTARPQPHGPRVEIEFKAGRDAGVRTLSAGRSATVTVQTARPGLVALGDSGMNAPALPLTPARFDVLFDAADRYVVLFTPADSGTPRKIGVLKVED